MPEAGNFSENVVCCVYEKNKRFMFGCGRLSAVAKMGIRKI